MRNPLSKRRRMLRFPISAVLLEQAFDDVASVTDADYLAGWKDAVTAVYDANNAFEQLAASLSIRQRTALMRLLQQDLVYMTVSNNGLAQVLLDGSFEVVLSHSIIQLDRYISLYGRDGVSKWLASQAGIALDA